MQYRMRLGFLEAVHGCDKDITFQFQTGRGKVETRSTSVAVPPGVVDAGLSDEHAPSRWMSCDASCCLAKSASAVRDSTPARAQVGSLGLYLRRRSGLKGFRRFAVPGPLATPEP